MNSIGGLLRVRCALSDGGDEYDAENGWDRGGVYTFLILSKYLL